MSTAEFANNTEKIVDDVKPTSSHVLIRTESELQSVEAKLRQLTDESPAFYKNHNLLILYLLIIPGALVPAVTLGFDGAMMNGSLLSYGNTDSTNVPQVFKPYRTGTRVSCKFYEI